MPDDKDDVVRWLLDGDPSIRWQVLRDLVHGSRSEVDSERQRVGAEGWGARLLAAQSDDGRWAHALYSPKWTSTTYTLLLLHWLGLPSGHPQALAGCRHVWDGARSYGSGLNLAKSVRQPETCITAMPILLASSFGFDDERLEFLDGGTAPVESSTECRSSDSDRDLWWSAQAVSVVASAWDPERGEARRADFGLWVERA